MTAAVRAVVAGPDGAAASLGDGVLADASTVSPQTTAQLGEAASGRFLASPILGSPMAVLGGQATYLIGGPRAHCDRVRPVYETLADENHRRYVGDDPTVASTLKLISNYLLLTGIASLAEAVATAQAAGLDDTLRPGLLQPVATRGPGAAQPARRHHLRRPPGLVPHHARRQGRAAGRGAGAIPRSAAAARRRG